MPTFPSLFIPHGGGPCFFMPVPAGLPPQLWDNLAAYLRGIPATLGQTPNAILVISAHWECAVPTVQTGAQPPLLFDYYGFPEHTYQLTYPAPGSPPLAARVQALLTDAKIPNAADAGRGFDHGVFVPFKLIYPAADIPIVQLSLQQSLDPAQHWAIGQALAPLREEGVLIVGSGNSYHNLRDFFSPSESARTASRQFDDWLSAAVTTESAERKRKLLGWEAAPGARACHPRSEHLLPLLVAAGAAATASGQIDYQEEMLGKRFSGYRFG